MQVRVRKLRPKILILLAFFGLLQAGLAAGPMRAGAENSRPSVPGFDPSAETPLPAAAIVPGAADALAADEAASAAAPAGTVGSEMAALVPPERMYLQPILEQAAREYGLPIDLILAQAWAESGWRMEAVSNKGAVGVLQLMPKAVDFVSTRLLKLDHDLDVLDPAANARMGARLMRHLLDRTDGDVRQALMAYNQGLSGLHRKGPVPAAETYADRVLALRPTFGGQA